MTVWLVTATGVYDHGVWYVGATKAEAEEFAATHAIDDDGYHEWRIDECVVGRTREPEGEGRLRERKVDR